MWVSPRLFILWWPHRTLQNYQPSLSFVDSPSILINKENTPRNNQCYLGDKVERESEGMEGTFDNCVMKTTGRRVLTCRHEAGVELVFLPLGSKDKMAGLPPSLLVMLIRVNIACDSVRLVHRLGKTQSIKQAVWNFIQRNFKLAKLIKQTRYGGIFSFV